MFVCYLAKSEPSLANFVCYWANYNCCKWPNINKIISNSGHTLYIHDPPPPLMSKPLNHDLSHFQAFACLGTFAKRKNVEIMFEVNNRLTSISYRFIVFYFINFLKACSSSICSSIRGSINSKQHQPKQLL